MSWSCHAPCKYHTQDTEYYCGAAAAMMVLAGLGVPYERLRQGALYDAIEHHNRHPGWQADPYGLQWVLDHSQFETSFEVRRTRSAAEANRLIVSALLSGQPVPALIFGGEHWVVVAGVETDREPTPEDGSYAIHGFRVNNPVHYSGGRHRHDDPCGSGDSLGVERRWMEYRAWSADFTPARLDGDDELVVLCPPGAQVVGRPRPARVTRHLPEKGELLWPDVAQDVTRALRRGDPRVRVVERLDRPREGYALVGLAGSGGDGGPITRIAQVDRDTGAVQAMHRLGTPRDELFAPAEALLAPLLGRPIPSRAGVGAPEIHLRPGQLRVSDHLVWRPCRESWSPDVPFWHILAGGKTLYLRVDGELFTALHAGRGG